jgi:hypothetical protein
MGVNGRVLQLFKDFKEAYDSVRKEALYNIRIEFVIPRKLVGLFKMSLNETYNKVHTCKYLTSFLFRMGRNEET